MNKRSTSSSRPAGKGKPGFNDKGAARGNKPFVKKDDDSSFRGGKKNFNKGDDDRKPFRNDDGERKPFRKFDGDRAGSSDRKRSFDKSDDKPFRKRDDGDRKPFRDGDGDRKPFKKFDGERGGNGDRKRSFDKNEDSRPFRKREDGDRKPFRDGDTDRKPFKKFDGERTGNGDRKRPFDKNEDSRPFRKREDGERKPFKKFDGEGAGEDRKRSFSKNEDKPFRKREDGERKPFKKFDGDGAGKDRKRSFGKNEDKPFRKREDGDRKPFKKFDGESGGEERKPRKKQDDDKKYASPGRMRSFEQEDLSFGKQARAEARKAAKELEAAAAEPTESDNAAMPQDEPTGKPVRDIYEPLAISEEKKNNKKAPVIRKDPSRAVRKEDNKPIAADRDNKPYYIKDEDGKPLRKRTYKQTAEPTDEEREEAKREQRAASWQKKTEKKKSRFDDEDEDDEDGDDTPESMPLNKYLAHSGVCSRREAAEVVKSGKVRVNDRVETNPGYKVADSDVIYYNDKKLTLTKGLVYILLNKPKDYITTNDDPQGRKTVMDLVANAGIERLFPVGRLDRNTTGLLLLTNDGDLTQKLAHPSFKVKKIYQVTTDKPVTKADFEKILNGLELEDGKAPVDALAYLETKNELGIEIHIGRNRIVRRIFESLGYEVVKLDRVMYGSLTKKNLPRGKWRFLSEREIVLLKHFKS